MPSTHHDSPSRRGRFGPGLKLCLLLAATVLLGAAIPGHGAGAQDLAERPSFKVASVCSLCHDNSPRAQAMRDPDGRGIAPFDLWQSTMMANASRDPFWRAVVAAEVAATPSQRTAIEAKCARCHLPMAEVGTGPRPAGHDDLTTLLECTCHRSHLAADGVSCTVCHRVTPDGLGTDASFSGEFRTADQAMAYGPHARPFSHPMVRHSGFRPEPAEHIRDSALCGSCHTLMTRTLDPDGRPTGHGLTEQSPYLEWRNSVFSTEGESPAAEARSCQSCHAPTTNEDGRPLTTRIAHNPGGRDWPPIRPRSPFGRHEFVGGNTVVPAMLRDHPAETGSVAPAEAFSATIDRTRTQLETRTATITIPGAVRRGDQLRVSVAVANLAGHKLPTAFPSRRVWIRFIARDSSGAVVFSSGAFDARGRLLDGQGRVHAAERPGGPIYVHQQEIRYAGEVQVYEAVMADVGGKPTYRLLRGARYAKDNRLLPRGWQPDHPEAPRIAPAGVTDDPDFAGGGDRTVYGFAAPVEKGPYTFEATLFYQALGARFVAEVLTADAPAVRSFKALYEVADTTPERLASVRATTR